MDKLGVAIQSTQRHHAKDRTGASLRPVGGSTPSERSIDQLGVVESGRNALTQQAAEPEGVADALRRDRVLEMPRVAGERPARSR